MPDDLTRYDRARRARQTQALQVLTPAEMLALPLREYLVKGVMSAGEMSTWWGMPKCGKSFLLMHVAYAVAQGRSVFGHRVRKTRVLYLACEGRSGLRGRIEALIAEHGDAADFLAIAQPIDLWSEGDTVEALIEIIKREQIGLVVVDTLNRASAGADENSPADMGTVIRNLDRIRAETGVHIAIVHHGTKAGNSGPRGHSSLAGALDALIEVAAEEDGSRTATLADAKDDASGGSMGFRLRVVELGLDADGDPRTTCLVDEAEGAGAPPHARLPRLGKNAIIALRTLQNLVASQGRVMPATDGFPPAPYQGVTAEEWRVAVLDVLTAMSPSGRRSAFTRAVPELLTSCRIGSHSGWVWAC